MEINLSNRKWLWLKGVGKVRLPNFSFGSTSVKKDLGVVVADTLTWATHSQSRTQKALTLFNLSRETVLWQITQIRRTRMSVILFQLSVTAQVCGNQAKLNSV